MYVLRNFDGLFGSTKYNGLKSSHESSTATEPNQSHLRRHKHLLRPLHLQQPRPLLFDQRPRARRVRAPRARAAPRARGGARADQGVHAAAAHVA